MEEQWSVWEHPVNRCKFCVQAIVRADGKLDFYMFESGNPDNEIKVSFDGIIQSYRYTDERNCLGTLEFLDENYSPGFYAKRTFFTIKQSKYIEFLLTTSGVLLESEKDELIHFRFLSFDEMIDVVVTFDPDIEWDEKYTKKD